MYRVFFTILMVFAFVGSCFAAQNACVASTVADIVAVDGVPGVEKGFINIRIADTYTDEPLTAGVIVDRINCQATKDWTVGNKGWAKMKLREANPDYLGLSFKCPGYIPVSYSYRKGKGLKIPTHMKVYLEQGLDIGGYVKNEVGEPIEGVTVEMWSHSFDEGEEFRRNIREISGKTDANGFWKIEKVWPDDEFGQPKILLKHPDYIDDRWGNEYINPSLEKLKKFEDSYVMKSGLTISGTVTDQDGKPLVKALVKSGDDWFPSNHEPGVRTDENGKFTFKAMKPSNWTFTAEYKDLAPQLITVQIDKDTEGIEFSLKPGKTIKIKVVDKDGKPIKGVGVCADTWKGKRTLVWSKKTDKDGMVTWTNVPDEVVRYDVYCKGYMSNRDIDMVARGEDVYEVVLSDPLVINVSVVDAKTGEVVKEFKGYTAIMWENSSSGPSIERNGREAVVGKDGKAEAKFTSGYYKTGLLIEADGYYPKESEYFLSTAGTVDCVVELEKGANIAGTIVTPDGAAAVGATLLVKSVGNNIYVNNGIDNRHSRAETIKIGDDGKFSMPPKEVIEGVYIYHESGYKLLKNPEADELENIELDKWVTIEGTAMTGSKPFANAEVAINAKYDESRLGYFEYKAKTDKEGRFKFENVIVREGTNVSKIIRLSERSYSYSNQTAVNVKPGDYIRDLIVGGGGQKVVGQFVVKGATKNLNWMHGSCRLSNRSNSRMPGIIRTIQQFWEGDSANKTYQSFPIRVKSDGTFIIEDVKPGSYELSMRLYQTSEDGRTSDYDYNKLTSNLSMTLRVPVGQVDETYDAGTIEIKPNEEGVKYYGIEEAEDIDESNTGAGFVKPIGQVLTPSGQNAVGAKVVLFSGGEHIVANVVDGVLKDTELPVATTGSNGEFIFDDLKKGVVAEKKYCLMVVHDEGFVIVRNITSKDGVGLVIELEEYGVVKGRVGLSDGNNAGREIAISQHSDMRVDTSNFFNISTAVASGKDGAFVIDKMIPGAFRVALAASKANSVSSKLVSVSAGKTLDLEVGDSGIVGKGRFEFKPAEYAEHFVPSLMNMFFVSMPGDGEEMPEFPELPSGLDGDEEIQWYSQWMKSEEGRAFIAKQAPKFDLISPKIEKDGSFTAKGLKPGRYRMVARLSGMWAVGLSGRNIGSMEKEGIDIADKKAVDLGTFEMALGSAVPEKPKMVVGNRVPEFSAVAIDGQMQQWYRLKGNYIVLDFWATWCQDCVKIMPEVKELYAKYAKNEKFKMVGIALENDKGKLKKFAEDNDIKWPQILAQGWKGEFAKIYNIKSIPQMFLIGPDGKIVAVGGVDDIEAVLEKKLSGK